MESADIQQKERIRSFFDNSDSWKGRSYDDQSDRFNRAMTRRKQHALAMLVQVGPLTGHAVLDVGCGCGVYLEGLAAMGAETYGMDLSPGMLAACRSRLKLTDEVFATHFKCGDIESIPFPSHQFHAVVCIGVFGYLFSDHDALSEIRRVLKPGGYLLVSVQNIMSLSNIDYVFRQKIRRIFGTSTDALNHDPTGSSLAVPWVSANSPSHLFYKSYHPWKWATILRQHGFTRLDSMTCGHEFRVLRRLRVIPESALTASEEALDSVLKRYRIPYFSHAGESYIGLFRRPLHDDT